MMVVPNPADESNPGPAQLAAHEDDDGAAAGTADKAQNSDRRSRGVLLTFLSVEGVILHEIPDHPRRVDLRDEKVTDSVPTLSDVETELTPDLRHYLENKIKVALEAAAFPVLFVDDPDSIVPERVSDLLNTIEPNRPDQLPPDNFVKSSQEMAAALHAAQTAIPPAGLLAVVRGTLRNAPFIALLKVEREEGLRLQRVEENGLVMMRAIVEHDLVMTQNTKVFKTGLFTPGVTEPDKVEGWVSDEQTGFGGAGRIAADFFVKKFLGCRLLDLPEVQTKKFFDSTERWINTSVTDPVKQADYTRALLADMASNKDKIKPKPFAEEHLHGQHRQVFINALAAQDAPITTFTKDTSLISNRLAEVKIRFEGGIDVSIARRHFDSGNATLEHDKEDSTLMKLIVRGVLERIRGG